MGHGLQTHQQPPKNLKNVSIGIMGHGLQTHQQPPKKLKNVSIGIMGHGLQTHQQPPKKLKNVSNWLMSIQTHKQQPIDSNLPTGPAPSSWRPSESSNPPAADASAS